MKRPQIIIFVLLGILSVIVLSGCGSASAKKEISISVPLETVIAATAADPCFQIGESVFQLGISTVQELADAGAVFSPENQVDSLEFSEDAWYQRELHFSVGNTKLTILAKNLSNRIAPLRESIIQGIYFDGPLACGIGGVMVGDTVEQVRQKLGDPFLIINTEDYRSGREDALMKDTSRVFLYVSRLDDLTVRICIDRNTSKVTLIEEKKPKMTITQPRQVTDDQIKKLVRTYRKSYSNLTRTAQLTDGKGKNQSAASGTLSNISYHKFKVLTLDRIKDSKSFYLASSAYNQTAPASSYLIVEYSAILTLDAGMDTQTRQDVFGCFYLPNAYLTDDGALASSLEHKDFLECNGVYLSEAEMIESIFTDSEPEYHATDYTSMERML